MRGLLLAGEGRSVLEDPAEEELGEQSSDLELVPCMAWTEPCSGLGLHGCDVPFPGFFLG